MTPYAEVIGDPIKHSKSPLIHGFWLKKLGIVAEYHTHHVTADALPAYFAERREDEAWRGCNITIPHKIAALDYVTDHLQHAYARTVHKTQGLTCEIALFLGDDALYAELGYTALTRGTHENRVYTVVSNEDFEDRDFHLEHVVRALDRSLAKTAAIDYLDPPQLP